VSSANGWFNLQVIVALLSTKRASFGLPELRHSHSIASVSMKVATLPKRRSKSSLGRATRPLPAFSMTIVNTIMPRPAISCWTLLTVIGALETAKVFAP